MLLYSAAFFYVGNVLGHQCWIGVAADRKLLAVIQYEGGALDFAHVGQIDQKAEVAPAEGMRRQLQFQPGEGFREKQEPICQMEHYLVLSGFKAEYLLQRNGSISYVEQRTLRAVVFAAIPLQGGGQLLLIHRFDQKIQRMGVESVSEAVLICSDVEDGSCDALLARKSRQFQAALTAIQLDVQEKKVIRVRLGGQPFQQRCERVVGVDLIASPANQSSPVQNAADHIHILFCNQRLVLADSNLMHGVLLTSLYMVVSTIPQNLA